MKYIVYLTLTITISLLSCGDKKQSDTMSSNQSEVNSEDNIKLSLAQWSLHKTIFDGKMDHLEFAQTAADMGFEGVEYVNQFFKDKAENTAYLDSMNAAAQSAGVAQLLIMVDGEGYLGDTDQAKRMEAVENHRKWVDAAAYLGCHSIRVNAHGEGTSEEVKTAAIDGLKKLGTIAMAKNINVLVENHGGYSSDGKWLADVMTQVNMSNVGTLPDFGNFCIEREGGKMWGTPCIKEYDRYVGVAELMPHAKAVSAKTHNFDKDGEETATEYQKMMAIVLGMDYKGYIGVEYEGEKLSEKEGILATKRLLEKYIK